MYMIPDVIPRVMHSVRLFYLASFCSLHQTYRCSVRSLPCDDTDLRLLEVCCSCSSHVANLAAHVNEVLLLNLTCLLSGSCVGISHLVTERVLLQVGDSTHLKTQQHNAFNTKQTSRALFTSQNNALPLRRAPSKRTKRGSPLSYFSI
jgi:hypothetical protein